MVADEMAGFRAFRSERVLREREPEPRDRYVRRLVGDDGRRTGVHGIAVRDRNRGRAIPAADGEPFQFRGNEQAVRLRRDFVEPALAAAHPNREARSGEVDRFADRRKGGFGRRSASVPEGVDVELFCAGRGKRDDAAEGRHGFDPPFVAEAETDLIDRRRGEAGNRQDAGRVRRSVLPGARHGRRERVRGDLETYGRGGGLPSGGPDGGRRGNRRSAAFVQRNGSLGCAGRKRREGDGRDRHGGAEIVRDEGSDEVGLVGRKTRNGERARAQRRGKGFRQERYGEVGRRGHLQRSVRRRGARSKIGEGDHDRRVGVPDGRHQDSRHGGGRLPVELRDAGRQERGVGHGVVFGLRPVCRRNCAEKAALVHAADEVGRCAPRIAPDGERVVVVRRCGSGRRRRLLDAVFVDRRGVVRIDHEDVLPPGSGEGRRRSVGGDVVSGRAARGNVTALPDHLPAIVCRLATHLAREETHVSGWLTGRHVEPPRNRKGVSDIEGGGVCNGEIGVGGAFPAVADFARDGSRHGGRSRAGRRGGETVSRRIRDRSARFRHVPDADVAGERALVAEGLPARVRAPAHDKLRVVRHRRETHPDERRAVRVPGVDFERKAGTIHVNERDVSAVRRRVQVGVGEPDGRVGRDADEDGEAGKSFRAGVPRHCENRPLVERDVRRSRQRGGGRQGGERDERGEEG